MSKFILFLTFGMLTFLFIGGLVAPNNPALWWASSSSNFALVRLALMAVVATLLITEPPRNVYLRAIVCAIAVGLTSWSLTATYQNNMKFLDTLSILEASVASGLVALESGNLITKHARDTVKSTWTSAKVKIQLAAYSL